MAGNRMRAVVVAADLFFKGKIAATAQAADADVVYVASEPELRSALDAGGVGLVIVNLEAASPDPLSVIAAARAAGARTAGYANHVQEDLMARARAAGCDAVMAKGAFTRDLAAILSDGSRG